jgi:hypothetical protein
MKVKSTWNTEQIQKPRIKYKHTDKNKCTLTGVIPQEILLQGNYKLIIYNCGWFIIIYYQFGLLYVIYDTGLNSKAKLKPHEMSIYISSEL